MNWNLYAIAALLACGPAISCATREAAKDGEAQTTDVIVPETATVSRAAIRIAMPSDSDTILEYYSRPNPVLSTRALTHRQIEKHGTDSIFGVTANMPVDVNTGTRSGLLAAPGSMPLPPRAAGYPSELYPGENVITITALNGIKHIEPLIDSNSLNYVDIRPSGVGEQEGCLESSLIELRVNTVTRPLNIRFRISDCAGGTEVMSFHNRTWNLDEVRFPDVMVGDTTCRPFQIGLAGIGSLSGMGGITEYLDSISVTQPGAFIQYKTAPPLRLNGGSTFRYTVCFAPTEPGEYRFPVVTWIRRGQPAGGYTNYPVADTAVVRVSKFRQY